MRSELRRIPFDSKEMTRTFENRYEKLQEASEEPKKKSTYQNNTTDFYIEGRLTSYNSTHDFLLSFTDTKYQYSVEVFFLSFFF